MKKKLLAFLLSTMMVFSLAGCTTTPEKPVEQPAAALYTAGTYTAKAMGNNADVSVEVVMSDSAITSVTVTEHKETAGISDAPIANIPAEIVAKQTLAVETIAGATVTSKAILTAAEDCLKQAGADIAKLKTAPTPTQATTKEKVVKTADIIIVGGGGAGMAAAVAAGEAGANSIVIEKMAALGGNTILAGGGYNAVDPPSQALVEMTPAQIETVKGILAVTPKNELHKELIATVQKQFDAYLAAGSSFVFDSAEFHAIQTYAGGDYLANLELVYSMTKAAQESIGYLADRGLIWKEAAMTYVGSLWPRSHEALEYKSGLGFIEIYQNTIKKNNLPVEIIMETAATEFIMDGAKVVGVKATGKDGTSYEFMATKGVILATGGFGANKDMRMKYKPSLLESLGTTNSPGITGDGIVMAKAIGAKLIDMDQIQILPTCDPKSGAASGYVGQATAMYLNKEGKRFVNELERRDVLTAAALAQTDGIFYLITNEANVYLDAAGVNKFGQPLTDLMVQGKVFKGETPEELAAAIGMDPAALTASITAFNEMCKTGKDAEFGRNAFAENVTLYEGPYYATPRTPSIHHTMGGLVIDTQCQVYNTEGKAIAGLWAAGEVTGGIHGTNRLGANAIPDALCNGRIAGTTVANIGK